MSFHILPQELVDTIIDHLHDDPVTLRSSALVCSAWLPASRHHILHRIFIRLFKGTHWNDTSPEGPVDSLYRSVVSSPEIVQYIRELVIIPDQNPLPNFLSQEVSLPLLLHMLTKLCRLEFFPQHVSQWHMPLIDFICKMGCPPSITELVLWDIKFDSHANLLRILHLFPELKLLELQGIHCDTESVFDHAAAVHIKGEGGGDMVTTRIRLDVLDLDSYVISQILHHPRCSIDLTRLRRLNVLIWNETDGVRMLLCSAPHLEQLQIEYASPIVLLWRFPDPPDLSRNPRLQTLDLTFNMTMGGRDLPPWISLLFSTVRSSNCLKELSLTFIVSNDNSAYVEHLRWWKDIDSILTQPQLSSLQRVDLHLTREPTNAGDNGVIPRIFDDIVAQFHNLTKRDILHVTRS